VKAKFVSASVLLALCLLASFAYADGPFSVTCKPGESGGWEYTLYHNSMSGAVASYMDINWIVDWDENQTPQMPFQITGSPTAYLWEAYTGIGFPSWNSADMYPLLGESVSGFVMTADAPALYFHVNYDYGYSNTYDQEGEVTMTPEPGSLLGLLSGLAGLGAVIRRRK